jgi:hypothetical protein
MRQQAMNTMRQRAQKIFVHIRIKYYINATHDDDSPLQTVQQ